MNIDQWLDDHRDAPPIGWRLSVWMPALLTAVGVLLAVVVLVAMAEGGADDGTEYSGKA